MNDIKPLEFSAQDLPTEIEVDVSQRLPNESIEDIAESIRCDVIYSTKYLLDDNEDVPDIEVRAEKVSDTTFRFKITKVA